MSIQGINQTNVVGKKTVKDSTSFAGRSPKNITAKGILKRAVEDKDTLVLSTIDGSKYILGKPKGNKYTEGMNVTVKGKPKQILSYIMEGTWLENVKIKKS